MPWSRQVQSLPRGHTSASTVQKGPLKSLSAQVVHARGSLSEMNASAKPGHREAARALPKSRGPARPLRPPRRPPAPNQRSRRVCDGARPRPLRGDKKPPRSPPRRDQRAAPRAGSPRSPGARLCVRLAALIALSPRSAAASSSPQPPVRRGPRLLPASSVLGCRPPPRRWSAGPQVSGGAAPLSGELALPGPAGAGGAAVPQDSHFPAG